MALCIDASKYRRQAFPISGTLFVCQGPPSLVCQSDFTEGPFELCLTDFILNVTLVLWVKCFNRSRIPTFVCHMKPQLVQCSSLSPLLSAVKTDSRGLHIDKPHRHTALTGGNPTTHLSPVFRLLHTLQVNLKPLYTGFPFAFLYCLMLLLFVIKQLNHSVSPHSRSIGFRGNCVGVLRMLQFP